MHHDISVAIVTAQTSIVDALAALDASAGGILFVTGEDDALLGALTDGDIRRHILAGKALTHPVSEAMNRNPVWVPQGASEDSIREQLVSRHIECVPVLDEDRHIVDAVWWTDVFGTKRKPKHTVDVPVAIMAGGLGTRLAPFTNILPKPLMPVGDVPVMQLIMDRFHEQGCSRFLVSLNHKASLIRAYFSDVSLPYAVDFFDEPARLGTAGSLALMRNAIDGTFVLANCDTIVDIELADVVEQHREAGNVITILSCMKHIVLPYGVCELGEGGALENLSEKPRFDMLVSTGIYVMEPSVLASIGIDDKTDATDLIGEALAQGQRVGVYPIPESAWLDVGQLDEFQNALDRLGIR